MGDSTIEWTDKTWNPVRGCTIVSEGCRNCYAMTFAHRFSAPGQSYEGLTRMTPTGAKWTGKVALVEEHLADPLKWRKAARVFVNSMSDLFHEAVPDEYIARVFAVIMVSWSRRRWQGPGEGVPQHTFQILTKRPERMQAFVSELWLEDGGTAAGRSADLVIRAMREFETPHEPTMYRWPLPNVWLGVSVEHQAAADERIPWLLETPAAVRFISYEPALSVVDWSDVFHVTQCPRCGVIIHKAVPTETTWCSDCCIAELNAGITAPEDMHHGMFPAKPMIDWLICGGESGPHARPMHPDWARAARDACQAAGVAYFMKQWGRWLPYEQDAQPPLWNGADGSMVDGNLFPDRLSDHEPVRGWWAPELDGVIYRDVGKKRAGRLLDGRTWDTMPGGEAVRANAMDYVR